ncbi:MAG: hypothetical protein ABI416_16285 [Ginsengibacter sp.]
MQFTTGNKIDFGNITQSVKQITDATSRMLQGNLNNNLQWFTELQDVLNIGTAIVKKDDCNSCPPMCDCPPQCLISVTRDANVGEVILVPFKVKNVLQVAKTYLVGVRPFYDNDGNLLPNQPTLNKTSVTLQPGQSILVQMKIDLTNGYATGSSYSTEIVIREKDVNQNICFTLNITANNFIPEAHPLNERDYFDHFQDWKSHYYCDKRPTITRTDPANPTTPVNPATPGGNVTKVKK